MRVFAIFMVMALHLFGASRGIIVAANNTYATTLIPSLSILRQVYQCHLPIEVWYSGDELSEETQEKIKMVGDVTFCDVAKILGGDPKEYRGYQIKGYMMGATDFDEVVLMDADVFFFQNPEVLFEHPGYLETGAFLFRDVKWQMFGDPHPPFRWYHNGKVSIYKERREYILRHIPTPSSYVPEEWLHYWDLDFVPSNKHPISSEQVETGCVIMDRVRHAKAIKNTVAFNDDRKTFFRLFLGEKETFWLGLEMAKEPYYINPVFPFCYFTDLNHLKKRHDLVHFVDGELVFLQKTPEFPPIKPFLVNNQIERHPAVLKNIENYGTIPTNREIEEFRDLTFYYHLFTKAL